MNNENNTHDFILYPEYQSNNTNTVGGDPSGGPRNKKNKKPRKAVTFTRKTLVLMLVMCIVVSGAFGFGGAMLANGGFFDDLGTTLTSSNSSTNSAGIKTTGFKLEDATGSKMTVQEITKAAQNSIVEIRTESAQSDSWMQQYVTQGAGSGIIIKKNGYIMTNNHVVDGANKIYVTLKNEKEYEATVVGTDSDTDVAVLKISARNLTPVTYGNSSQLNVGDLAVAIGNPLGKLGGTVTAGIVSALERELTIDGKSMSLIQTDSSINPGNSGGGLFNQYGQLVGVVVAKSSGSDVEGLGFAIPVNTAAEVAQQLMDNGYVKGRVTTGMTYTDMTSQNSSNGNEYDMFGFGGGSQTQAGIYIENVSGSAAKDAGFQSGDMVYSVDGKEIDSMDTLTSVIKSHKVGDSLKYVLIRNNQKVELTLELTEQTNNSN